MSKKTSDTWPGSRGPDRTPRFGCSCCIALRCFSGLNLPNSKALRRLAVPLFNHSRKEVPTDCLLLPRDSGAASEDSDAALAAAAEGLDVADSPVSPPANTGPSAAAVGALARFGLSARQEPEVIMFSCLDVTAVTHPDPSLTQYLGQRPRPLSVTPSAEPTGSFSHCLEANPVRCVAVICRIL